MDVEQHNADNKEESQLTQNFEHSKAMFRVAGESRDHNHIAYLVATQGEEYEQYIRRLWLAGGIGFLMAIDEKYLPEVLHVIGDVVLALTSLELSLRAYLTLRGWRTIHRLQATHIQRLHMIFRHFKQEPLLEKEITLLEYKVFPETAK